MDETYWEKPVVYTEGIGGIDWECRRLCIAMNDLYGVKTTESCIIYHHSKGMDNGEEKSYPPPNLPQSVLNYTVKNTRRRNG